MFRAILGYLRFLGQGIQASAATHPPTDGPTALPPRLADKSWRLDVRPAAQRRGISLPVMRRLWMGPFW